MINRSGQNLTLRGKLPSRKQKSRSRQNACERLQFSDQAKSRSVQDAIRDGTLAVSEGCKRPQIPMFRFYNDATPAASAAKIWAKMSPKTGGGGRSRVLKSNQGSARIEPRKQPDLHLAPERHVPPSTSHHRIDRIVFTVTIVFSVRAAVRRSRIDTFYLRDVAEPVRHRAKVRAKPH